MRKTAARVLMWLLLMFVAEASGGLAIARLDGATLAITPPAVRQRDLLSEAGEDHFWVARMTKEGTDNSTQTSILYRSRWSGNGDWTALPPIPDRVESMATSNGELLLVLANGQWEIANDTEFRSGPTDAMWDTMLAIASGQDAVWAIVRGSEPSTQASDATTSPTTEPATQPGEARLMTCEFNGGKWTKGAPIPDGVSDDSAEMSLTVVKGLPVLAWRTAMGKLCVSRMSAENVWSRPVFVGAPAGAFDFKLLTINERSVLWVAAAPVATLPSTQASSGRASVGGGSVSGSVSGAGEVMIGDDYSDRIKLEMQEKLPTNITAQTLVAAFGNLRWIAYAGDQQIEQDYSLDAFPKSFPPAKMSVTPSPRPAAILLTPWIGGDAILILLAGLLAMRQRNLPVSDPAAELTRSRPDAKPRLAPMGVRFVAGMVDLAPILGVIAILHPANAGNPFATIDARSFGELSWLSLAAYVLHTLIAEMICGQSIGKMIFGLRVVSADGGVPKMSALLIRNLLRVVDVTLVLPMLIVLLTPLQQRVGDIVAGTVVIAEGGSEGDEDGNGGQE